MPSEPNPPARPLKRVLVYCVMVAVTVLAYLWIAGRGADLVATEAPGTSGARAPGSDGGVLAHVLLALALITVAARLAGVFFQRVLRQPPVMGEIVAGLVLGPSVLGALAPSAYAFVLPAETAPYLAVIAYVGVVLFMFLVGLELDLHRLRQGSHVIVLISHASILAPFLLGAALALWLYPRHASAGVPFLAFSLFMGIALSVTAFPVLARILLDRGVQRTRLGATALACAAVGDATAWTLLALLAGLVNARLAAAGQVLLLVLAYVAAMFLVVRPLVARGVARVEGGTGPLGHTVLALVYAGLLLSAFATEAIGIHALFGAFLLGALVPSGSRLARQVHEQSEGFVLVLLLPAFFVLTGMRTRVGLLDDAGDWLACAAIICVATLGKFGGSVLAARLTGMAWRPAAALGLLMNTRGLMELIVLNLGLDLGVITPKVFTMMVLMALVTTFTATPALALLLGRRGFPQEPDLAGLPENDSTGGVREPG